MLGRGERRGGEREGRGGGEDRGGGEEWRREEMRIIRESGEGAVRAVTIALKVPVSYRRGQPTSWDVGLVMEVKK